MYMYIVYYYCCVIYVRLYPYFCISLCSYNFKYYTRINNIIEEEEK